MLKYLVHFNHNSTQTEQTHTHTIPSHPLSKKKIFFTQTAQYIQEHMWELIQIVIVKYFFHYM